MKPLRLLAIALILAIAAISCSNAKRTSVAPPPASATPDTVVRTYFEAAMAGDRSTVIKLFTPEWQDVLTDDELANWVRVSNLKIGKAKITNDRAEVTVTYDLIVREETNQRNGPQKEAYYLVHTNGRWLIHDQGSGNS